MIIYANLDQCNCNIKPILLYVFIYISIFVGGLVLHSRVYRACFQKLSTEGKLWGWCFVALQGNHDASIAFLTRCSSLCSFCTATTNLILSQTFSDLILFAWCLGLFLGSELKDGICYLTAVIPRIDRSVLSCIYHDHYNMQQINGGLYDTYNLKQFLIK